jgi:hypothetical protein
MPQLPGIVTRDFAEAQSLPRAFPAEATREFQSGTTHTTTTQAPPRNKSIALRIDKAARQQELDRQSSELDRSIALKKQAAAKALLKLQEVMAMPTWEQAYATGPTRAPPSTAVSTHWRNLSLEDGGPIAPSAIFQKVKIPFVTPPVSIHSTFFGQRDRAMSPSAERWVNGTAAAEAPYAPSSSPVAAAAALSDTSYNSGPLQGNGISNAAAAVAAAAESPERPWQHERRGRSAAVVPQAKGSHSRMGSAVSAMSGTSAYSLPYHMVPARGSSMRDSGSSFGDIGVLPKFDIAQLGWQ